MNHQRIYIIFFVFVALICQIYISAAPTKNEPHFGPGPEKLPNETSVSLEPETLQPTKLPTTTTTPKSNASNVMILQTFFAFIVIQMFLL